MTEREAIEIIKNTRIKLGRANGKDLINQAFNIAIEALEKQIGKKPIIKITKSSETGRCPKCKKSIDPWEDKYVCHHCLQRLDWSEKE